MKVFNIIPRTVAEWYIRDQQEKFPEFISVDFSAVPLKEGEKSDDRNVRVIEATEELLEKHFLKPPLMGGGMLHQILNAAVIAAFRQYKSSNKFTVADAFILSSKNRARFWDGVEVNRSEVLKELQELQITKKEYSEVQAKADDFIDLFYDFGWEE